MMRIFLVAIVFGWSAMVGQSHAQCTGNYANYYSTPVSNSVSSCGGYYSGQNQWIYSQPRSIGAVSTSPYRTTNRTAKKLPTPDFLNTGSAASSGAVVATRLNYPAPISSVFTSNAPAVISAPGPSSVPFNSTFGNTNVGNFLSYPQPGCASGNCPYR